MVEITAKEQNKEERVKRKYSPKELYNNIKCTFALWESQKEKREKGPEKIFEEIIAENFLNLGKETVT